MLRVNYAHVCDTCLATFETQLYEIGTGGAIPLPGKQYVINNHMLCKECAELVTTAANEVLKDRLKRDE